MITFFAQSQKLWYTIGKSKTRNYAGERNIMKTSHNMYYSKIIPVGFDSRKTQRQRRKYLSITSEAWVTLFEYHNLWWYVFDVSGFLDLRSVGYVCQSDLLKALDLEMKALGFLPVTPWEDLEHD